MNFTTEVFLEHVQDLLNIYFSILTLHCYLRYLGNLLTKYSVRKHPHVKHTEFKTYKKYVINVVFE